MLRILTYNILDGGGNREALLLEVLRAKAPDVVILQEVFEAGLLAEFATAMGMHYFFAKGNSIRHLGLLSRYPIRSPRSHNPFPIRCAILEAQIELEAGPPLQIIGIHLAPFVAWYREIWRALELRIILRLASQYANKPLLIAGDCNAIAPNDRVEWVDSIPPWLKWMLRLQGGRVFHVAIRRILTAGYTDSFRYVHPAVDGFTLPTPEPHARLDYIFVNDHLRPKLQNCEVVRDVPDVDRASDHYPVFGDFVF